MTITDRQDAQLLIVRYAETRRRDIKERAFEAFRRLVPSVLKVYRSQFTEDEFHDLLQEGTVGLLDAMDRYDPKSGCAFSTYAVPYIRGTALKYIDRKRNAIRMPADITRIHSKIDKVINTFVHKHHRHPTEDELCMLLNCSPEDYRYFVLHNPRLMRVSISTFAENADADADEAHAPTPVELTSGLFPSMQVEIDLHEYLSVPRCALSLAKQAGISVLEASRLLEDCELA